VAECAVGRAVLGIKPDRLPRKAKPVAEPMSRVCKRCLALGDQGERRSSGGSTTECRVREPEVRWIAGLPCALLIREGENRERVAVLRVPHNTPLELADNPGGITARESGKQPAESARSAET